MCQCETKKTILVLLTVYAVHGNNTFHCLILYFCLLINDSGTWCPMHLEALLYIVFSNPTCSLWPCINRHLSEPQLTSPPLIHPLPCGPLKPRAPLSNCSLKSWRVTKGQEQGNTCCLYPHSPESAPARCKGSNVLLGSHAYISGREIWDWN